MGPEENAQPSLFQHITPHVHWLSPDSRTDRPILGAVTGEQSTLIVDAGNSLAHAKLFCEEIARVKSAPPRFLVLTHWHWDHVFGSGAFQIPAFASLETRRKVTEMAGLDWSDEALDRRVAEGSEIPFCRDNIKRELPDPGRRVAIRPPEIGFEYQIELDLGGITCHLVRVGGDHDPGSTVVWVKEEKVMFISDCLGEDYYSGPPSYTTERLFPLLDRLLSYDVEFYLEGHSEKPTSRQRLNEDAELFKMIGREVERPDEDRESILSHLGVMLGRPLNDDDLQITEGFINGLRKKGSPLRSL